MSHAPFEELAAAYALGALDAEERERFEAHLGAGCGTCSRAVLDYQEALARAAADLAAPPPARVRQAVLERLDGPVASVPRPAPVGRPAVTVLRWAAGLAMAAGLAAWVTSAWVGAQYERQLAQVAEEAAALRAQLAAGERDIAQVRASLAELQARLAEQERTLTLVRAESADQSRMLALLQDPETRIVTLAGLPPSPGAKARMLWNPRAGGLLVAADLPPLPEGKIYELWAIAAGKPVPAGLFAVDAQGRGSVKVSQLAGVTDVDVFAVTIEPAAGVPAPTGAMVLASKKA